MFLALSFASSIMATEQVEPKIAMTETDTEVVFIITSDKSLTNPYTFMCNPATQSIEGTFCRSKLTLRIKQHFNDDYTTQIYAVLLDGPSVYRNVLAQEALLIEKKLMLVAMSARVLDANTLEITIPKEQPDVQRKVHGGIVTIDEKDTPLNLIIKHN